MWRRRAADAVSTELHSPGLRSPEPRSPALRSPGARLRSPGARSSMERALPARAISNKNVEWLSAPGAWTFVVALIVLAWLLFSLVADPVRAARGAASAPRPPLPQASWTTGSRRPASEGRAGLRTCSFPETVCQQMRSPGRAAGRARPWRD